MTPRTSTSLRCALGALVAACSLTAQTATLTIDATHPKAPVSPMLYGLMTEEINYSYDGGLYAELIRNRTFRSDWSGILNWYLIEKGTAAAKMSVDKTQAPSAALKESAKIEIAKAAPGSPAGILNEGWWGIPGRPNTKYKGSLWAKFESDGGLPLNVALVSDTTGQPVAQATIQLSGSGWKEYKFEFQSGASTPVSPDNHFEITAQKPGTLWLQLVSLFPPTYKDRANGNRIDLMEKMAAMKPTFLRFPGGNYLEGNRINTRFKWKEMIGPMVDRPTHPGTWNYHSSDGMGLLEFLYWCEDLKMEPVLGVYAGYSLGGEVVKPGPELEPYIQEALEEIEYVTGGPETKWGKVRAEQGHPAPFKLQYVEIGNEDNFDRAKTYDGRYAQFYKAIKAKYPQLQLIATMPINGMTPDVLDDHYYKRQDGMYELTKHYDKADRKGPKIFIGEWATREGSPTPNLGGALGDAAFMTSMERNSDVIIMSAFAPLFVNVNPGGMQWASDLIGYDTMKSYGSPGYYAQVMFSSCLGDNILDGTLANGGEKLFYSATSSAKTGKMCLKLVNASSNAQPVSLSLKGLGNGAHKTKVQTLRGSNTWATNTLEHPDRVKPVTSALTISGEKLEHTMPGYSIQVLEIDLK